MKIWFDCQSLQTASRLRGIGRYTLNLIREIRLIQPDWTLVCSLNAGIQDQLLIARRCLEPIVGAHNIHVWEGLPVLPEAIAGDTGERRFNQDLLQLHVSDLSPDWAVGLSSFEGMFDAAVPYQSRSSEEKTVAIFYDDIPSQYPDQYFVSDVHAAAYERRINNLDKFGKIFAISEFSADQLRARITSANISVIGCSHDFVEGHVWKSHGHKNEGSINIIYVGGADFRKRLDDLLLACAQVAIYLQKRVYVTIVGFFDDEQKKRMKSNVSSCELLELLFPGRVDDRQLIELYLSSDLAVNPSSMEGFGITVLESLALGLPTLVSNIPTFQEIVLEEELRFECGNVKDLAGKIITILQHETIDKVMSKIRDRVVEKYSWVAVANEFCCGVNVAFGKKIELSTDEFIDELDRYILQQYSDTNISEAMDRSLSRYNGCGKLYIDVTGTAQYGHHSGIQRVVRKIYQNLRVHDDVEFIYFDNEQVLILDKTEEEPTFKADSVYSAATFGPTDKILMLDSTWEKYEITERFLIDTAFRGAEIYTCVYDLIPIYTPAFCHPGMPPLFASWFKSSRQYSSGYICISETVRKKVEEYLNQLKLPRVYTTSSWRLGADFSPLTDLVCNSHDEFRFLIVGTLEPRKGIGVALRAFERLWEQGFQGTLTIIGKVGWEIAPVREAIDRLATKFQQLKYLEFVSDLELSEQYRQADCIITCSFEEGFGLPIIEAAHYGKPVIASDIPVFREVGGSSPDTLFFKSGSSMELEAAVLRMFKSSRHITKTAYQITWAESASELKERLYNAAIWSRTSSISDSAFAEQKFTEVDYSDIDLHLSFFAEEQDIELRSDEQRACLVCVKNCGSLAIYSELGLKIVAYHSSRPRDVLAEISPPDIIPAGDFVVLRLGIARNELATSADQITIGVCLGDLEKYVKHNVLNWES